MPITVETLIVFNVIFGILLLLAGLFGFSLKSDMITVIGFQTLVLIIFILLAKVILSLMGVSA